MPIYAYRCTTCGHAQDVLQKMSDPLLTVCPNCGNPTYQKQVTAAGFQLKGSGWYVTDFRGDKSTAPPPPKGGDEAGGKGAESPSSEASANTPSDAKKSDSGTPSNAPSPSPSPSPTSAPAASAAPASPSAAPSSKPNS